MGPSLGLSGTKWVHGVPKVQIHILLEEIAPSQALAREWNSGTKEQGFSTFLYIPSPYSSFSTFFKEKVVPLFQKACKPLHHKALRGGTSLEQTRNKWKQSVLKAQVYMLLAGNAFASTEALTRGVGTRLTTFPNLFLCTLLLCRAGGVGIMGM